ncbi:MAG: flagellar basal body rod C-terminal domain-containing protein [Thermodesulfobacteriota bacterium]|nr:flagellar basal body rod C-terminal domain-containing protein [Thermodesulfobacteriota bacterium]
MPDSLSALGANSVLLANASSNLANLNTQGYKAIRTSIVSSANGEPGIVTTRSDTPGALMPSGQEGSNVDISKEYSDMILAQTGYEAALNAIQTREKMIDDLMEVFSSMNG